MPKVKLRKQENYEFEYKVTLNHRDINYGGHLGNDSIVSLSQEARMDLLKKLGFTELNLGDNKTGIIMSDLAVNYTGEAFMFDEITIFSHIDEIKSFSFRVFHSFMKNDNPIALLETGIIAFDYSTRKISELPEIFLTTLENYKDN